MFLSNSDDRISLVSPRNKLKLGKFLLYSWHSFIFIENSYYELRRFQKFTVVSR